MLLIQRLVAIIVTNKHGIYFMLVFRVFSSFTHRTHLVILVSCLLLRDLDLMALQSLHWLFWMGQTLLVFTWQQSTNINSS